MVVGMMSSLTDVFGATADIRPFPRESLHQCHCFFSYRSCRCADESSNDYTSDAGLECRLISQQRAGIYLLRGLAG